MTDNTNHAILSNEYLDFVKKETDKEKRFNILKKFFVQDITKNVYQNMDLLNALQTDFDKFNNMYTLIKKDLILKVLLAVDTLVSERQCYQIDLSEINIYDNIFTNGTSSTDNENEYSICESYIGRKKNKYINDMYKK